MAGEILEKTKAVIQFEGEFYSLKVAKETLYKFYNKYRTDSPEVFHNEVKEWCADKMKRKTNDLNFYYKGLKEMSTIVEKFMADKVSIWGDSSVEEGIDVLTSYTNEDLGLDLEFNESDKVQEDPKDIEEIETKDEVKKDVI